jgi:hypothetical protein
MHLISNLRLQHLKMHQYPYSLDPTINTRLLVIPVYKVDLKLDSFGSSAFWQQEDTYSISQIHQTELWTGDFLAIYVAATLLARP